MINTNLFFKKTNNIYKSIEDKWRKGITYTSSIEVKRGTSLEILKASKYSMRIWLTISYWYILKFRWKEQIARKVQFTKTESKMNIFPQRKLQTQMASLANTAKILRAKQCQSYTHFWENQKWRMLSNLFKIRYQN